MEKAFLSHHSDFIYHTEYPGDSEGNCTRANKCSLWHNFVNDEMRREMKNSQRIVANVTISTTPATTGNLNNMSRTCGGSSAKSIMDALTETVPFNNNLYEAFNCNGAVWKVGRCGSEFPSICVNCDNPCTDSKDNHLLNCLDNTSMKVFVADFIDTPKVIPPESEMTAHSDDASGMSLQTSATFGIPCFLVLCVVVFVAYNHYVRNRTAAYSEGNIPNMMEEKKHSAIGSSAENSEDGTGNEAGGVIDLEDIENNIAGGNMLPEVAILGNNA